MPTIDGGHYFLTVLAPIRRGLVQEKDGTRTAPMIVLRKRLSLLPTAMQTLEDAQTGKNSPFAGSNLTHFARFCIIDRSAYDGYTAPDPVWSALGLARSREQHDLLRHPYLLFAAEFDSATGSRARDLAVYLRELWGVMENELRSIFENCDGFANVETAADFITFIKHCELETTMPYNYYWVEDPQLPTLTRSGLCWGAAVAALLFGGGGGWYLHQFLGWWAIVLGLVLAIVAAIGFVALRIKGMADRPFPTSPDGTLNKVLKGLHLQNTFDTFVIANQSSSPQQLHDNFAEYLKLNRVSAPEPTHPAGRVHAGENMERNSL